MAYGDVKREPRGEGAVYEDIDKMVRSVKGKYEPTECPAAYEFPVSQPAAPVYDTVGEATKTSQQQHTSTETTM